MTIPLTEEEVRQIAQQEIDKKLDFLSLKNNKELAKILKQYSRTDHKHTGNNSSQINLKDLISGKLINVAGTDGSIQWAFVIYTTALKLVVLYLNGFKSVAGVKIPFASPFLQTPTALGDQSSTATVAKNAVTITASSDTTGWVFIIGN